MNDTVFCTAVSTARDESLVGTAIDGARFLVCLEFERAWPKKIFKGPELPEPVVAQLEALDMREDTRVQYIRRPDRELGSAMLLVADTLNAIVHRWNLGGHDGVLTLDWTALERGELPAGGKLVDEPVVLVCTHGKRDACCAKWGMAFWRELLACEDAATVQMWQTSHLGGHRFAATAVVLPHGYHYGRLEPEDAEPFMAAINRGELYGTERLRGRTCLPRPAQAAEIYSRQGRGGLGLDDVVVDRMEPLDLGEDQSAWRVYLEVAGQPESWDIAKHTSVDRVRPPSCGKPDEAISELLLLA